MSLLLDVALFLRDNQSVNFTHAQITVMYTLAARIGRNDSTWIKQEELAKETRMSKRNLIRILNRLSDLNILNITKKQTSQGVQNNYELNITLPSDKVGDIRDKVTPVSLSRGGVVTPMSLGRCHPCHLPTSKKPSQDNVYTDEIQHIHNPESNNENNNNNKTTRERVTKMVFVLPEWLPETTWEEWLQERKLMKAPMSIIAQKKAIKVLENLKSQGSDPIAVIDQSIINQWKGFFPIKVTRKTMKINGEQIEVTRQQDSVFSYMARLNEDLRRAEEEERRNGIIPTRRPWESDSSRMIE